MLHLLAFCAALGLLAPWLVPLLADHSQHLAWLFDLASHWQWLHLALLLIGLALLLVIAGALTLLTLNWSKA